MSDRVAAILTNYNMPERTDALVAAINARTSWPLDWYVIDNGSDLVAHSRFTNVFVSPNEQTTGGWLRGLASADRSGRKYLAYWMLITSGELPQGTFDPLRPMAQLLLDDANAVGVHPALTWDSTTAWKHLITRGTIGQRRTWMIDNIAALWRADWFNSIGRFDPALRYGWGVDLETSWTARRDGRALWVHEDVYWKKVTNVGYAMNRMRMTAGSREKIAGANMAEVLGQRFGSTWWSRMNEEFVDESMR